VIAQEQEWEILSDSEVVEDLIMYGGKPPVQILSGKRKKALGRTANAILPRA